VALLLGDLPAGTTAAGIWPIPVDDFLVEAGESSKGNPLFSRGKYLPLADLADLADSWSRTPPLAPRASLGALFRRGERSGGLVAQESAKSAKSAKDVRFSLDLRASGWTIVWPGCEKSSKEIVQAPRPVRTSGPS